MAKPISFARGAPSLDIVDVEGLKASAARAFKNDPGGVTAYGTSIGYPPLREWIAERHQVVDKEVAKGRTHSRVRAVEGDDRVRELARLLGGQVSQVALEHARELLAEAQRPQRRGRKASDAVRAN